MRLLTIFRVLPAALGFFWMCSIAIAQEGRFVSPNDVPPPFRRDRIPLETTAITNLSYSLSAVAQSQNPKKPVEYRNTAKLLALALGLDPANSVARKSIEALSAGRALDHGSNADSKALAGRIRNHVKWLETKEAGTDANQLSACLRDVWPFISQKRESNSVTEESSVWKGWIPELSAYTTPIPEPPTPEPSTPNPIPVISPPLATATIESAVATPEIQWLDTWTPKLAILTMEATLQQHSQSPVTDDPNRISKPNPIRLRMLANDDGITPKLLNQLLKSSLSDIHHTLPDHLDVRISSPDFSPLVETRQWFRASISSAAALVLANSSITGIAPKATVLGEISEKNYKKSPNAWQQLKTLEKAPARRIVVPTSMQTELMALLAMEKPELLFKHQFLAAGTIPELLDLVTENPDPATRDATSRFAEIQVKIGNQDLRTYIGNRFIKQRIEEITKSCPNHLSAKLLLIQANGQRPTEAPRPVIAQEIVAVLVPLAKQLDPKTFVLDETDLVKSIRKQGEALQEPLKDARWALAGLERYTARADREIFAISEALITTAEALEKVTRTRTEEYELRHLFELQKKATLAKLVETIQLLHQEFGDLPPVRPE